MEEQGFEFQTTANIDAKLHRDILAHEDKIFNLCVLIFFLLLYFFRGPIGYWLKFGVAIQSGYDTRPINVKAEPVQSDYTKEEKEQKIFTYKSLINKNTMVLMPQAHYKLSARVVAYNHDFVFISKFFDSAALYDLGAAWGNLSDKFTFKRYIKVYSQKVEMTGSRRLNWQWRYDTPFNGDYINSHISHSHIIPANRNIMAALLKIKVWDKVEIEGELVDMKFYDSYNQRDIIYQTSLSRTDVNANSRGNGACETIYATKVRIGNKVYK